MATMNSTQPGSVTGLAVEPSSDTLQPGAPLSENTSTASMTRNTLIWNTSVRSDDCRPPIIEYASVNNAAMLAAARYSAVPSAPKMMPTTIRLAKTSDRSLSATTRL